MKMKMKMKKKIGNEEAIKNVLLTLGSKIYD